MMSLGKRVRRIWRDPPPRYAFEVSRAGIAYSRRDKQPETGFRPLETDVLAISPLKDNVVRPDVLFEAVRELTPRNGGGRRRPAALILPDYCARVAVLDFDSLPSDHDEQLSLIRFRLKKSIPFDLESAKISFHVQAGASRRRKYEVVAAVAALEIVARYEAAFRNAGFQPGEVTLSSLAAFNLLGPGGLRVAAKLSGDVLTALVADGRNLRLLRCIELPEVTVAEVMGVLYPTFAYVEDEFGQRPAALVLCGFGALGEQLREQGERELGVTVEPLRSRLGEPGQANAGLLGYLEMAGE